MKRLFFVLGIMLSVGLVGILLSFSAADWVFEREMVNGGLEVIAADEAEAVSMLIMFATLGSVFIIGALADRYLPGKGWLSS